MVMMAYMHPNYPFIIKLMAQVNTSVDSTELDPNVISTELNPTEMLMELKGLM